MKYDDLSAPIKETLEELKTYVDNQVSYNKLVIAKRSGELSSYLLLLAMLFGLSSFVLLFLSFAFAGWFSQITNLGIGNGYLVVAGFYIILALIVYVYREPLIFKPVRKVFGDIFYGDSDSPEDKHIFETKKILTKKIKKSRKELDEQKLGLTEKINDLGNTLTLTNIAHQFIEKAYSSVMTTSNVAKFTYNLIKKIKWFTEKKKRKAAKLKSDKLLKGGEV